MTDVLTLALDPESQATFEGLRQRHFPPERNQIPAHLTLFHTLPRESWVSHALAEVATSQTEFVMGVTGVRSLGKGVAYTLRSSRLDQMHADLADRFREVLTPQDRQAFRPHIVVQNKVTPEMARKLLRELEAGFKAFPVRALGVDLWHYQGGPWELAGRFRFAADGAGAGSV